MEGDSWFNPDSLKVRPPKRTDDDTSEDVSLTSISSKLPSRRAKNEFYRYYAGYSLPFAEWALREMALRPGMMVIDPWNGSGTTGAACAKVGVSCHGFDINPVMVHLGRARTSSVVDFSEAHELIAATEEQFAVTGKVTFADAGAAFRDLPVTNEVAHSVAISALFPLARITLHGSQTRNPSWYRKGSVLGDNSFETGVYFADWRRLLAKLALWRNPQDDFEGCSITVDRGDSRRSLGRADTFDAILTSPPYLTRLDYVQATLPELLLLNEFDVVPNLKRLRRSMLGSPLTSHRPTEAIERLPKRVLSSLQLIKSHDSKASSSYYHRFFSTYFVDLQSSLKNLAKVLKTGCPCCIVVQSSSYKEIEIDLASAVVDIAQEFNLREAKRKGFPARQSMSLVNSRAHIKARTPKSECAIFLAKV